MAEYTGTRLKSQHIGQNQYWANALLFIALTKFINLSLDSEYFIAYLRYSISEIAKILYGGSS